MAPYWSPGARRRDRRACCAARRCGCWSASTGGRCRRSRFSTCAGSITRCTRRAACAGRLPAAGRAGDRAAEPSWVVELPLMRCMRTGLDVPRTAMSRWYLHRAGGTVPATTAATASRSRRAARTAAPYRSPVMARDRAARVRAGDGVGGDGFPVFRLDADTGGADARRDRARALPCAPAGLLVGTQMIAKGHDFSDVGLGVVDDADQTLRFPDFRAEERTFALVTQFAGRVGRSGAVRAAVLRRRHDGPRWAEPGPRSDDGARRPADRARGQARLRDLSAGRASRRRALGYPPFRS